MPQAVAAVTDEAVPASAWLEEVRQARAVSNGDFRLAHLIASWAEHGDLEATTKQLAAASGLTPESVRLSVERLSHLRFLLTSRRRRQGALLLRMVARGA